MVLNVCCCRQMVFDLPNNSVKFVYYFVICKTQYIKAPIFHNDIPVGIVFLFQQMYRTINFNNQLQLRTIKVSDIKRSSACTIDYKYRELPEKLFIFNNYVALTLPIIFFGRSRIIS